MNKLISKPYTALRPFVVVDPKSDSLRSSLPIRRFPNGYVVHPPYDALIRTALPMLEIKPHSPSTELLFHFIRVPVVESAKLSSMAGQDAPANLRRYRRLFLPVYHVCRVFAAYHYDRDRRGNILADTQRIIHELTTTQDRGRVLMFGALSRSAESAARAAVSLFREAESSGDNRIMREDDSRPLFVIHAGPGADTEEHGMVEACWKTIKSRYANAATLAELSA